MAYSKLNLIHLISGDHYYVKENAEFVGPKTMPKNKLLSIAEDDHKLPIHRVTYTTTPRLTYTKHELHIKNIDKFCGGARLFHFEKENKSS